MTLSVGEYLAGAAFLLAVVGACGTAAHLVTARFGGDLHGLDRGLAVFTLASGAVVVAHVVPGAVGLLGRPAVAVVAAALLGAAWAVRRRDPPAPRRAPAPEPVGLHVKLGVALAAGGALGFLLARAGTPVTAVDAVMVHLPQVARYLQAGSFAELVQYTPGLSNATYPQNGTMLLLAAALPWESTFLARFVAVPFVLVAALSVYAIARAVGAPRGTAALAAAAVTAMPAVSEPGLEQAQVDAPMLAWFGAGAYFLLRAARSGDRFQLALAAAGLGLAFGTKWYAMAYVPVLLALFAVARRRRMLPELGLLAGGVFLLGGFWLARNWVLTGNPVHPARVRPFGLTIFDAPPDPLRDASGFTVADYLLDARVWRERLVPEWGRSFGLLGPILLAGLGVAAARIRDPAAGAVVAAAVAMGLLYTILPDTAFGPPGRPVLVGANARYLVPALLACAVATAWLAARHPRRRLAVELLLLAGIADGVRRSYGAAPAAVVAGVLLVLAALTFVRLPRLRPAAVSAVVLAALVAGGYAAARAVDPAEYGRLEPVIARLQAGVPEGGAVALEGVFDLRPLMPALPAFGPRLRNRVDYLGRFEDGTLRRHRSREAFLLDLRARRYDAVLLGKGLPPAPDGEEPVATWAEAAGYRRVEESEDFVLLLPARG